MTSDRGLANRRRHWVPAAIVLTAVFYIGFAPGDPLWLSLAFKVLPMMLIIGYAISLLPADRDRVHTFIVIGLGFCAIGDVTLEWFLVGLTAFLLGHLWYLAGFLTRARVTSARVASVVPLAALGVAIAIPLLSAIQGAGDTHLLLPVAGYIIVILTMAWAALLSGNRWAIVGSLLFVTSDAILSWNMFVADVTFSGLLIMATYYSAQFCIARSVADFG
ncbi:lysoplasmalogenase [Halobacteria archaeon AArc-curdl1]|uniref:Lysoplasmalogenase n=1 Tax=Natronosalvus hydrolyticus TaxID=2979988 RepID=A0AAP2Z8Z0_9EURY|nr:lysoplasmalogenase [Halobacteria archaeon AArc-curdl1]